MQVITFCVDDGVDLKEFTAWRQSLGSFSNQTAIKDELVKDESVWRNIGNDIAVALY